MEINDLVKNAKENANAHGWAVAWSYKDEHLSDLDLNESKVLTIGETLALCHSELSEALEAFRDDDKENFAEEIADEFIRLGHLCGDLNINIEEAIIKKMEKNKSRPRNHGRANY